MHNSALDVQWISGKSSVSYSKGITTTNFKTVFRVRKDSVIWMSFIAFGIEAGRVLLNPDTIMAINRLSNQYFIGGYEFLLDAYGVEIDFESIQALILGNALDLDMQEKVHSFQDNGLYLLSGIRKKKLKKVIEKDKELKKENRIYSVWLDPVNFKVVKQSIYDFDTGKSISLKFNAFESLDGQLFPMSAEVFAKSEENIKLEINHSNLSLEGPKPIIFKIPEKYEQIK